MVPLNRRKFLTSAAVAAAAAGLTRVAAPHNRQAELGVGNTALAATQSELAQIKHVVILMQENRGFNHYFGKLKGVRGFADRSAMLLDGGHSVFRQPNGSGRQYPWSLREGVEGDTNLVPHCAATGLGHSWWTQHAAWNSALMDNWVAGTGSVYTMGYLDRTDIPFHYALADAYTVCDAYHCSALTGTGPNRAFLWSGKIDSSHYFGGELEGCTWETYAENLQDAGVSWKVYHKQGHNFGDNALEYFTQFMDAEPGSPLYDRGRASVPGSGPTHQAIIDAIRTDVVNGTLPQVSWVVTNQEFSEHPSGSTPADGHHFTNMLIQALNADEDVFDSAVLFITYDENDGFFDHVPPPVPPGGTSGELIIEDEPVGLGFRVPMLVVSPWTRGGWVNSQVFDHTSVIQFMEKWTAAIGNPATCPNISAWRRKVCGDLTGVFNFASPVYGLPSLPATAGINSCDSVPNPEPATNVLPAQEPGTRPARALPYQSNGYLDRLEFGAGGKILTWFRMENVGTTANKAAHFSIHPNAHRSRSPWQYTVDAGGTEEDYFNVGAGYGDGRYDISMYGPNRFMRRFTGDATKAGKDAAVSSRFAVQSGTGKLAIWFRMKNTSATSVTFTIKSNAYRSGTWTYTVAAGGSTEDYFNNVAYAGGWYDFTITVSSDVGWSQRFLGHIETGAASISG
ncbi:phospholipase C, phosphocholine-specific [Streptomyces sp. NBC_00879]|uniref:phosphocholine-specific phospholipase C n=1 Tax=Streptomyces sp. NBC_00879 TaxID=2975855 RepID=UPI00386B8327|nr:phospholipase C, phosphocholine-specific [Streptomyces sp. NBC_00879]